MSISSRISSMEEHVTNAYNGLQGLGADLTGIDKNIDNIAQVLDDIYDDLPKVTGSGTSITLDDTRKGRLESTLSGNTSQYTTTGKNFYSTSMLPITEYGITISKNANGDIVLNGTPNFSEGYKTFYTGDVITVEAGTYTLSVANKIAGIGCVVGGFNGGCNLTLNDTVTSKSAYADTPQNVNPAINIRYDVGTLTNFVLNPQMEKSSSATTYEPYTNGVSPNPDFPQEVNVVRGDNKITVCSKNLVNANFSSNTINGVTQIGVNNVITLNGANNKAHSFDFPNTITYEPNTTYTTHVKIIGGSFTPYKQDSNWAIQLYNLAGTSNITLTSNNFNSIFQYNFNKKTTTRPRLWFGWEGTSRQGTDGVFDNLQIQIMVVKGAYSLSDYPTFEPFDGDYYPINLPVENKFDDSTTTNILIADDGTEQANNAVKTSIYIKVEPNTLYTCSSKLLPNKTSGWLKFSYYDASKNYLSYLYTDNTIRTITTPNNCGYIRIGYHTNIVNDVQFEKGSKANSYTPYGTTPIELCKIGNYQDYFGKSDGRNLFIPTLKVDNTDISVTRCTVSLSGDEYTFSATSNDMYFGNIVASGTSYQDIFGTLYDVEGISNLVFKPTNSDFDKNFVCFYDKNKVSLGYEQINNSTGLITPLANTKYIGFRIGKGASVSGTTYKTKFQLEKGSSATPYQPYGVGKWYLHKEIGKVVLNGSETISSYGATSLSGSYQATFEITTKSTSTEKIVLSNYFASALLSDRTTKTNICYTYSDGLLRIATNLATTMADFKNWLSSNNVVVYYVLATPVNIPLEDM